MRVALVGLGLVLGAAAPLSAQLSFADRPRVAEGRVVTPALDGPARDVLRDSTGLRPVGGTWVTLHRIAGTGSGPLDSVRTDPAGNYRLTFTQRAGDDARYVASATFAGITYFTPPLTGHVGEGDLTVFDTTSRAFPLGVRGRHIIVRAADTTGHRTVIEVFDLANDSARTLVTADRPDAPPTFRVGLPGSARDVRAGDSDVPSDAIRVDRDSLFVTAPFAPGVKQLSFSYLIPARDGVIELSIPAPTSVLEVLLEDTTATVSGATLAMVAPVTVEGRAFRRALGQDAPAGASVRVILPVPERAGVPLNGIALVVGAGAFALLLLVRRGARRATPVPVLSRAPAGADLPVDADDLAREIAALDAHFATVADPSPAVRSAYEQRRRELKDALARAMTPRR